MLTTTPTCKPTSKGFSDLRCPLCGEQGVIRLALQAVTDDEGFHCEECGNEFGTFVLSEFIRTWGAVLQWVESMPDMQ